MVATAFCARVLHLRHGWKLIDGVAEHLLPVGFPLFRFQVVHPLGDEDQEFGGQLIGARVGGEVVVDPVGGTVAELASESRGKMIIVDKPLDSLRDRRAEGEGLKEDGRARQRSRERVECVCHASNSNYHAPGVRVVGAGSVDNSAAVELRPVEFAPDDPKRGMRNRS